MNSIDCNDQNTPNNAADDTYSANITVNATGGSNAGFNTSGTPAVLGAWPYGSPRTYQLGSISGSSGFDITFTDFSTTACSQSVSIDPPASCSGGGGNTNGSIDLSLSLSQNPAQPLNSRCTQRQLPLATAAQAQQLV